MAGLGFKDFQVGEVLTAADVDGYLMQQSVMRFADSAARGSALGTATGAGTALAEGMVSYLADSDTVEVYDGSAWTVVGGGTLHYAELKTTFSASVSAGGNTAITGLSIPNVALSKATNRLIIMGWVGIAANSVNNSLTGIGVYDGTSFLALPTTVGNRTSVLSGQSTAASTANGVASQPNFIIVHAPGDLTARTYSMYAFNMVSSTRTVYINRTADDTDIRERGRSTSALIILEVAA